MRRLLLLATVSAFAAVAETPAALTCAATVAPVPTARQEGLAEFVGDLVLRCTGGDPAVRGPYAVQLTLNTRITNGLAGAAPPGRRSNDAQLIVEHPAAPPTRSSVFKAQSGRSANTVTWDGVSLDTPAASDRFIRLTNIRADASALTSDIVGFVQVTGPQSVAIDHPQQTLAHIRQGLFAAAENVALAQCVTRNPADPPAARIVLKEGFAQSFSGARIRIRFDNLRPGARILLPDKVPLTRERTGDWAGGYLQRIGGEELTGAAPAVYEVVDSNPSVVETAEIAVRVAFESGIVQGLPAPGQVTANVSFDPASQFCDRLKPLDVLHVDLCTCNLLFPVVTKAADLDTVIMIVNSSPDPFGIAAQPGPVTLWFYGVGVPPAAAVQTTTAPLAAGEALIWTSRAGGVANAAGLQAVPGFSGFIIAQANFQNCHGFADVWDIREQKRVDGYQAIRLTGKPRRGDDSSQP